MMKLRLSLIFLCAFRVATAQITTSEVIVESTNGLTTIQGNLAIGVTSTSHRLHVGGDIFSEGNLRTSSGIILNNASPILFTGTASTELNRFLQLINSPNYGTASGLKAGGVLIADNFSYASPGKNDLIVKGNVGVGVAIANHQLHVGGDIFSDGILRASGGLILDNVSPILFTGTGNTQLNRYLQIINSPGNGSASGLKTGGLLVADAYNYAHPGKNDLIVKGNVGIGVVSTTYKLDVNGALNAQSLYNSGQLQWSDFVFEKDYELPTLKEVEEHIAENGHLQDVPSEVEVLDKGYDLGAMDAKLLQKIEELTLYLVEQNKKIERLEGEIVKLKAN